MAPLDPLMRCWYIDEENRNFIWWVEQAFRQRGLTCDMLFLNPRLQLSAVVKRQVLEGVQAVVFLNRQMQTASKISIQVFDRRGEGEASFDRKRFSPCSLP
jgi:nuclear polyadenylated RNA-binding protein 3